MPLVNTIKVICYSVLITFIVINSLKIFNTLNTYQLERIETIKKALN